MSRESILIVLGILVAVSPWSGLPLSVLAWVLPILGLAVAFIGFTLRARSTDVTRNHSVVETSTASREELY